MSERWLPVPGFEGLYEVSDLGRVKSLPRQVKRGNLGGLWLMPGRMLKPYRSSNGYLTVNLCKDGVPTSMQVHRLVLLAFAGPCPPWLEARHGPGGPLDNRLANLSYGTSAENKRDKIRDGTHPGGERNASAKLTTPQVIEIRSRYSHGESQAALAREYGVTPSTMWALVHNRTWPTATGPAT